MSTASQRKLAGKARAALAGKARVSILGVPVRVSDDGTTRTVLSVRDLGAVADRRAFDVTMRYNYVGTVRPDITTVTFVGPARGAGPVTLTSYSDTGQWTVFVVDPAQYGEIFGPEWFDRFYGPRDQDVL